MRLILLIDLVQTRRADERRIDFKNKILCIMYAFFKGRRYRAWHPWAVPRISVPFNARARAHRKASRGAIHTLQFMGKINRNLFACCYTQASDDDEPIVAESPNRVPGSTLDVTMQQIANVREQEVKFVRLGFGFAHKTAADAE